MNERIIKVIYLALSLSLIGLIAFLIVSSFLGIHLVNGNVKNKIAVKNFHQAEPSQLSFYETAYKFFKEKIDIENKTVIGGIIPHHLLAADIIADFFSNLSGRNYDTIVLLSPNHFQQGKSKIITSNLNWQTPYGEIAADRSLINNLLENVRLMNVEEDVFAREHGIKAEVAFIKKTFPQAKIVPLVLEGGLKADEAENLARAILSANNNKNILVLASVDFSHYTTNLVAQEQDQRSIALLENMDFNNTYKMAVDSPPSIYTLLKYAEFKNSSFKLLKNSNSALLSGKLDLKSTTSYISGYFVNYGEEKSLPKNGDGGLRLLFWGDTMLDRNVKTKIDKYGFDYLFNKIASSSQWQRIMESDLVGANLEGATTNEGKHYAPINAYDFAFSPDRVSKLKSYGFNFFTIANNHLADQGENGIIETDKNLEKLGIFYFGCADRRVEECSVKIKEINGKRIGWAGFSMVYGKLDEAKAIAEIKNLASSTDLVIVNMHWGVEYEHQFNKLQQDLAHRMIDTGADIIIGHHPHVVQGMEIYNGKPIFYSLGNFIFDQYFSPDTQEGLGVLAAISDDELVLSLLPIESKGSQVEFMNETSKEEFLNKFVGWSALKLSDAKQILSGEIKIKYEN